MAHVEVRAPDLDGRAGLLISPRSDLGPSEMVRRIDQLRQALGPDFLVEIAHLSSVEATASQRFALINRLYQRVPLEGFMQVNDAINRALISSLIQEALRRQVRSAFDLYCGSGNFLLPLADAGLELIGVEQNSTSVEAARLAASEQRLPVRLITSDVATFLRSLREGSRINTPDLVVLDPPRAGLGRALEPLQLLTPQHIALCSCNPSSLEKDLRALHASGYTVQSLELFDMFCHTNHVEVLAWLHRDSRPHR